MDCEMVGVGIGGLRSILARVSIVNIHGEVIYDKYVLPSEKITDYRTKVSGIIADNLTKDNNAIEFSIIQREVSGLLKNRYLIGHGLKSDLEALIMTHPKKYIRDTAFFKLLCPRRPLPLKVLAKTYLLQDIQSQQHDSIEDARTALQLYLKYQKEFEATFK